MTNFPEQCILLFVWFFLWRTFLWFWFFDRKSLCHAVFPLHFWIYTYMYLCVCVFGIVIFGVFDFLFNLSSLILQYHTQLLELLEIPQLMDTCVRNGYYEDALDLENHVQRLCVRFESNKIIKSIVSIHKTHTATSSRKQNQTRSKLK